MSSVITDYCFSGGGMLRPNLLQIVVSGFVLTKKFAKSGVSALHALYYKNIYYMQ